MRLIHLLKHDLCHEAAVWAQAGIISEEQAASICARYGIDYDNRSRRTYGYHVLVGFGCLFIGLSLITLVGANWEAIPRGLRMAALMALTLGANLGGLVAFGRENRRAAIIWLFLGGLFYGASIMLIAQIYHIGEHFPDGLFWWALGVLPMALLLQSTLMLLLASSLSFIWFFVETSLQFFPTLFPLFLAAIGWHLWRGHPSKLLFLTLLVGVGLWCEYSLSWFLNDTAGFRADAENVALAVALFVYFQGVSKWLAARQRQLWVEYGIVLGLWVLRFMVVTLFVFSFSEPWEALLKADWRLAGITVAIALALCTSAVLLVKQAGVPLASTAVFALLFLGSLTAVLLVRDQSQAVLFQIAANIMLVMFGIKLIVSGIQHHISHLFYTGVIAILVTGLLRYIDLVGDYIGASVLFAVLATILLLAAQYWKKHQPRTGGPR
jgi:uncharacterized membrane protein